MPTNEHLGCIVAGRYRVRRALGAGAHGRVYLAEDLGRGGSHVALKLVEGLVGGVPEAPADEILRQFHHPHWASVFDQGDAWSSARFQAVQYVPGRSLDHLQGAQPVELVWQLLEDGARVLGALHRWGLIHYDVTPGNVMLSDQGGEPHFVLTDGGLAHLGPVRGVARGTPQFMAPEVTEDGGHDHRADLYGLGLVAFRLATGRDPFEGGAGEVLGARRREEAPRARTFRLDLPGALDDVLAELLARAPSARPHDALALLARLNGALERDVPPFLHSEAIAAAEGGALVGRGKSLERYAASLNVMRERMDAGPGRLARARAPTLRDPVHILRGQPGSGVTRLAREYYGRARDAGVPALLMSGRETTGDRRGPLRHLVDGMAALGVGPEDTYREIRLDLGSRRALDQEDRAHMLTRAVEQFVRGVDATAERTPFLLVIEDFPDLPPRAQEAVRVLSRHLLARCEGGGSRKSSPVLLIVDVGDTEPESLLVADATDPQRPITSLGPLTAEELAAVCAERFPGLEPRAPDVERVRTVSEGLPGALVSLLAEGCRRGDLRQESGRWSWNIDALDGYEIPRGLSPVHADALRSADVDLLRLLGCLSLVEAPLEASIVQQLWERQAITPLPTTPLIRTVARDDKTLYTTSNLAIRKAVLEALDADLRRSLEDELLAALDEQDSPDTALDRARIAVGRGRGTQAIEVLSRHWDSQAAERRMRAQGTIRRAITDEASLIACPGRRQAIAALVEHGVESRDIAQCLAAAVVPNLDEPSTVVSLVEALSRERAHGEALSLLVRVQEASHLQPETDAALWTLRSWVLFDLHRADEGSAAARQARHSLRSIPQARFKFPVLKCKQILADAQARFLRGDAERAAQLLRAANALTRGARRPALRARVLNNLGIVEQHLGRNDTAREHLERSLRIRRLTGDVEGAAKCMLNLGRVEQRAGALVKSASHFQQTAATAQRFAQHSLLSRALWFLAQVYDQQWNSRLAIATLNRALTLRRLSSLPIESALAAWDLAPLAAACGDLKNAALALRESALAARERRTSYARAAHHMTRCLVALHTGAHERLALCLGRMRRHASSMYPEMRLVAEALINIAHRRDATELVGAPLATERPELHDHLRTLWRAQLWMERMARPGGDARRMPTSSWRSAISTANHRTLGRDRRLLVETALAAAVLQPRSFANHLALDIERLVVHAGETHLLARLCAVRSIVDAPGSVQAQLFSRSLQLLEGAGADTAPTHLALPDEHRRACRHHGMILRAAAVSADGHVNPHALAHRLLVHHGCTAAPDSRVASALRRVLAATGRMNAGAGLDDLLQRMTQDTIDITGAERACLVLVHADDDFEMRTATTAAMGDDDVAVADLSQTVIQRVIDSRTPLLLHDVFDDEELMGRPSITSLSLRSILCVPMLRGDTLYGVLYADSASAAGSFDRVDQEVLALFAEQAASALETHRLVADVQNSMSELKAMQERLVRGERLRTMGELSSGVAHEFNNLLTSILARVQLISLNNVGHELQGDLDLIEKACLDAAAVVRRLQSFTRKQRQEHFERIDLAEICNDAVEFLRPLWSTRRRHGRPPIRVAVDLDEGLFVHGNATELREVITNLLKNALDAQADGGRIDIRAGQQDGLLQIELEDDGPGIAEDVQSRIFDPFFTTKGERGTGLGLCLSQQIVERHGGEITVHSRLGEGTRFSIELPAADGMARTPSTASEVLDALQPAIRVLVVDDDENVRNPLCRFLEKSGYDVTSAADGAEGQTRADADHPDVVISDVAMPVIDGLELCRRLRSTDADVPIVLMSGWSSGVDPARARRAGATALLAKPFALQQVAELLGTIAKAAHRESDTRPRRA